MPSSKRRNSTFNAAFKKILQDFMHESAADAVAETYLGIADSVVTKTPVRTGFARSRWRGNLGTSRNSYGVADPRKGDRKLPDPMSRLRSVAQGLRNRVKNGESPDAVLYNDCVYIYWIEVGGGNTPMYAMARRTHLEFDSIMAAAKARAGQ